MLFLYKIRPLLIRSRETPHQLMPTKGAASYLRVATIWSPAVFVMTMANIHIRIPQYAMGMVIGQKGTDFERLRQIPELDLCKLDQPSRSSPGILIGEGSVRACVVLAERAAEIVDRCYERNVRRTVARKDRRDDRCHIERGPVSLNYNDEPSTDYTELGRTDDGENPNPKRRRSLSPDHTSRERGAKSHSSYKRDHG